MKKLIAAVFVATTILLLDYQATPKTPPRPAKIELPLVIQNDRYTITEIVSALELAGIKIEQSVSPANQGSYPKYTSLKLSNGIALNVTEYEDKPPEVIKRSHSLVATPKTFDLKMSNFLLSISSDDDNVATGIINALQENMPKVHGSVSPTKLYTVDDVVTALEQAGMTVKLTDPAKYYDMYETEATHYDVDGAGMSVAVYEGAPTVGFYQNGQPDKPVIIEWIRRPHAFQTQNLTIIITTNDAQVAERILSALKQHLA